MSSISYSLWKTESRNAHPIGCEMRRECQHRLYVYGNILWSPSNVTASLEWNRLVVDFQAGSSVPRPYTQQSRPPTSAGRLNRPPSARPPSASGMPSAIPPGTASRLASAMQYQPPPTRAGSSMGRPPSTVRNVIVEIKVYFVASVIANTVLTLHRP